MNILNKEIKKKNESIRKMSDILNEKNKIRKDKFNNLKIINVNKIQIKKKSINKKDLNRRLNNILCEIKNEINLSYEGIKEKEPKPNQENNIIINKNKVKLNSNIKNNEEVNNNRVKEFDYKSLINYKNNIINILNKEIKKKN